MKNLLFVILILLTSCTSDRIQAENSLEGEWDVIEIQSIYGEFFENGFNPDTTIIDEGALGSFRFTEDNADYIFTRNDSTFSGTEIWGLTIEKVRQGFSRETKFWLTIDDEFLFETAFEDETFNAERNAQSMRLIETPETGFGVMIVMELVKR